MTFIILRLTSILNIIFKSGVLRHIFFLLFIDPFNRDGLWSVQELFNYYKNNLGRFTNLITHHQLDAIFRPGKYSPEAANNIEMILQYVDANFKPTLNATNAK